ncbi:phage terminase large subunit [Vibrio nigripulchritudo]|uniref:hypothetical protein n=1 Tax=Vibrio nigripulchritudo TaxID=28173 RepID=UPI00190950C6|nr:hypothetical protein [Vibrio nigripulchritudo]BCL70526.1 phage terminase large subunit [Vibrio nigripulchritudo]BDU31879.1 phage terminase large subunit [Vibrio nigripulchritudo]
MDKPDLNKAIALLGDRKWRLNHLYYIEDKKGQVIRFQLNAAQENLLHNLHYLNLILKARQMGFSTFILLLALDCCLFNSNLAAGLVADTLDNAKGLLSRIKFAYERLPADIKQAVPVLTDNALEVRFGNESSVEVGVSLRSSTKNFLHISEYGKICAQSPDKASEIRSGALNTLAHGQLGFIESTAEGRGGDFFNKTEQARKIQDEGRDLLDMEWKFHFFPWFQDPSYQTRDRIRMTADEMKYFDELATEFGIQLTEDQQHWYVLKWREQAEDMKKEYPSTPEEAFSGAREGAYFGKPIQALRQRGKIGRFEFEPRSVVNTFWDLGVSDSTTIWLHQEIAGKHRFVGYYENSGEGIAHYIDWLDRWRTQRDARFGRHFGPHDVEHRKQGLEAKSIKHIAAEIGFAFEVVPRTPDKLNSIQSVRTVLPECEFDASACDEGILHLENYSRDWDEKYGVWKRHPRHDEHSHGADAFMVFADGYQSDTSVKVPEYKVRKVV